MILYLNHQPQFADRVTEWLAATVLTIWGGVLLLPQDTYASSPAFKILALFVPEPVMGGIMVLLGTASLIGLIVNGRRGKITPWVRLASAWGGFMAFTGISTAFALSGTVSTWIALYPVFAALEFWNIRRAAHDAGKSLGPS